MKTHTFVLLPCLLLSLAACQRTPEPAAATQEATQAPADAATAVQDQPHDDVPPATAPPGTLPPRLQQGGQSLARYDGYGDLRLGMRADEVHRHWGGELKGGADAAADPQACYYLLPQWADSSQEFGFMIEADKLVRYDSGNPKELAPGGGRVGMSADEIERLYPGQIEQQPHKYVEGAHYLRIQPPGQSSALIFETDETGKVTHWRVGTAPSVDYVEGCS
ncbi:MAG TPA: lectin [Stenotrophomonas sp.]|jgi:hypothetical protein